ncbi:hypothetical protein LX15_001063 [Streptoalloteichus tenebrarius]|uniref:Zinc-finger n=1 Tax=Streptoalloteichus tenebrarius (strain ATCC 17920 / DSM 40477 / JCM 4838 / CBS 697.72 / NBRC 16177 / NCIMB 11028 / NRRL B-12390 / A12253. 1 / ISP 5477) TaxID=1933 RepID=A0ABT1HPD9_STRSD|nr:zinc finger protein [Streptoalloteichus tenebrarius]MCP2257378.1 hypothetical protein [Streptoalloteichus tenebrarius]BFF04293.1 hypothetical protein GCM10020241_59680 [Streptoalloteichus tenebrarius]
MTAFDFPSHTWLPYAGERHAHEGGKRPEGETVTVFCGLEAISRTYHLGDPELLWPECDVCRVEAARCADLRAMAEERRRNTLPAYGDSPPHRKGYRFL